MKFNSFLVKRSLRLSFSVIAGASTIAGLLGYTVQDLYPTWQWWKWSLILGACFLLFSLFFLFLLSKSRRLPYKTKINGKPVVIKSGDIFTEAGWKVIPFNDRFDTQVDDIVISHSSLNGQMIDKYVDDIDDLNSVILSAKNVNSSLKPKNVKGYLVYPPGRIIIYKEFLMLSFSHFNDQNMAYIHSHEYEFLLFCMWTELRRVYASKPIFIPLLGAGITNIEGESEKDYTSLLRRILCSLKQSKFAPSQGISIV